MRDKLLVPPRKAAWLLGGISTRHLWSLITPRGPIPPAGSARAGVPRRCFCAQGRLQAESGERTLSAHGRARDASPETRETARSARPIS